MSLTALPCGLTAVTCSLVAKTYGLAVVTCIYRVYMELTAGADSVLNLRALEQCIFRSILSKLRYQAIFDNNWVRFEVCRSAWVSVYKRRIITYG